MGTFYALNSQEPDAALIVAISDKTHRHDWKQYAAHFNGLLQLIWPATPLLLLSRSAIFEVDTLHVCHLHDAFDDGRRAFQGMQPSLLGATARQKSLRLPPRARPRLPLRIGIAVPTPGRGTPGRSIHNADELVRDGCAAVAPPPRLRCELVYLDHPGCDANVRAVLRLHALVALHGAHVTYAAFPERPFALLEVRPYTMSRTWFRKYHQTAFALDTWTYAFEASEQEHRPSQSAEPQRQGAVLPLGIFREFAAEVVDRFFRNSSTAV